MKKIYYAMAALLMGAIVSGCSDENYGFDGEGVVKLRATINSDVKVVSRADVTADYASNCNIWISSTKGLVRKYTSIDEVPVEGIRLLSGSYVAEAWAGDSVSASFDKKFFKGRQAFEVTNGSNDLVDLKCKIANTVASVNYQAEVDQLLKDYTMTVSNTKGTLTFEGRDDRRGYFMMPNAVKDLTYTLEGKKMDGSAYTLSGTIENVKPTTEYIIKVKCGVDNVEIGGAFITIEVDERELLVEDEVVIGAAPVFKSNEFDLTQPIMGEMGAIGGHTLWVLGSTPLTSVVLECEGVSALAGGIDLIADAAAAEAAGVVLAYPWAGNDACKMRVTLSESLLNSLPNGQYVFKFTACDDGDRTAEQEINVLVSDAQTAPLPVETSGVDYSARTLTLRGTVLKEGVTQVGFQYRAKGTEAWTDVEGQVMSRAIEVGSEFSAYITGLEPGTTYEYRTTFDGTPALAVLEITTEPATQLPNSSFEDWQTSSSPYLIYAQGGEMFWDSGNHGSATMRKNVTVPDATLKHSGNYSIKLSSQFVGIGSIGKFAAGNVFIGEYLKTDGTDGVLGFGRPFTGRPVALKGYVRYAPVAITHADADAPADIVKGEMDRGTIYIALLDGTTDSEYPQYPVVIKTKTKQLFDKNGSNVIAYGELLFDATPGSDLVEFTVPLTYNRTDIRPSFIMCTASASKGGDYFAGGNGSNMWLDDLQLVY